MQRQGFLVTYCAATSAFTLASNRALLIMSSILSVIMKRNFQKDGCMNDKKGRQICCCSRDLCNSSYSNLPVLLLTIIPVLVSKVFVA
ncbi:unnamed protein product [Haemonchus placei]|uniref:Activin_recp domain-containing protein n=1 Tax=Haemonchus placei TaxID=6290 RepID=A0A0N4XA49_HAEPC|nr:unnamed protein product [Haemonchus placei]